MVLSSVFVPIAAMPFSAASASAGSDNALPTWFGLSPVVQISTVVPGGNALTTAIPAGTTDCMNDVLSSELLSSTRATASGRVSSSAV